MFVFAEQAQVHRLVARKKILNISNVFCLLFGKMENGLLNVSKGEEAQCQEISKWDFTVF